MSARRTGSARVTVQVDGKALAPSVAELGTVMAVREEQFKKAYLPMEVRLAGSVTAVREGQSLKAKSPMEVRLSGKVTAVRAEHS